MKKSILLLATAFVLFGCPDKDKDPEPNPVVVTDTTKTTASVLATWDKSITEQNADYHFAYTQLSNINGLSISTRVALVEYLDKGVITLFDNKVSLKDTLLAANEFSEEFLKSYSLYNTPWVEAADQELVFKVSDGIVIKNGDYKFANLIPSNFEALNFVSTISADVPYNFAIKTWPTNTDSLYVELSGDVTGIAVEKTLKASQLSTSFTADEVNRVLEDNDEAYVLVSAIKYISGVQHTKKTICVLGKSNNYFLTID